MCNKEYIEEKKMKRKYFLLLFVISVASVLVLFIQQEKTDASLERTKGSLISGSEIQESQTKKSETKESQVNVSETQETEHGESETKESQVNVGETQETEHGESETKESQVNVSETQENQIIVSETKESQNKAEIYANDPPSIPLTGIFKVPSGANSYTSGNKAIITESKKDQMGSIFSTDSNMLNLNTDFNSEMYIKINGEADGITFIMHNDVNAVKNFQAVPGEGLSVYSVTGYTTPRKQVKNSFVVEFDTYYNSVGYDRSVDYNSGRGHVAYSFPNLNSSYRHDYLGYINGNVHYGVQYPKSKIGNNVWRKFSINWKKLDSSKNGILTYAYEGLPPVSVSINRDIFAADKVYWGFTGSTGETTEEAEVIFKSVPGLVHYENSLSIADEGDELVGENSFVKNDTLLKVQYSGKYEQASSKQNLLKPTLKFNLSSGQKYQTNSFTVNGESVNPVVSGNTLSVNLPDFTGENSNLDVSFEIKTEGLKSFDKPTVNSNLSGTNYKQTDGTSVSYQIDSRPPKGLGRLRVIEQYDAESLTNIADYKELLIDWSDDVTEKDNVIVDLKEGQDIQQIIETLGPKKITLTLTDEVGNLGYVDVPLYIKEKGELISSNDTHLIKAENIKMFYKDYPKTTAELVKQVLSDSKAELWQADEEGILQKMDSKLISVDASRLPEPGSTPESKDYPVSLSYTADESTVTLPITSTIIGDTGIINLAFIDEMGDVLHDPIILEGDINTTIDLTKEEKVQEAIQSIVKQNYVIDQKPENETAIPIKLEESSIKYMFKGKLFVQSFPKYLNFGRKSLGGRFIKVEQANYDQPLIIWDNRKPTGNWTLTATLLRPLASLEDPSKELPLALKYKVDEQETLTLLKGTTQTIASRKHQEQGPYNISREWDKNTTGVQLEVSPDKVVLPGKYRANILWQVAETP